MKTHYGLSAALLLSASLGACAHQEPPPRTARAGSDAYAYAPQPDAYGMAPEPSAPVHDPVAEATPVVESPDSDAVGIRSTVSDPRGPGEAAPATQPMPSTKPPAPLTDGQIVQVTEVVNEAEIAQAKAVLARSSTPAVKRFATHMISAHGKAEKQGAQLAQRQHIAPEESELASDLKSNGDKTLAKLQSTDAAALDRAYIEARLSQHEAVLDQIDERLMPSATSPALRASLEETRRMVDKHAAEARALRERLSASR